MKGWLRSIGIVKATLVEKLQAMQSESGVSPLMCNRTCIHCVNTNFGSDRPLRFYFDPQTWKARKKKRLKKGQRTGWPR